MYGEYPSLPPYPDTAGCRYLEYSTLDGTFPGTGVLILDRLGSCKVLSLQGISQEAVSPDSQNRACVDVQALHRWMLGAGCWFTLGGRAAWVSNSFLAFAQ